MGELEIPDPSVVILVGAAGAGKSTFAARHFPAAAVLSSDAYRAAIAGDPADQTVTAAAFTMLHRALDRRLADGGLAIVDATNLTAEARRKARQAAARHGLSVVAIVLDLPADVVHHRNARRRERVVPEAVVNRQLTQLATVMAGPLGAEGYARIFLFQDQAAVDGTTVRLVRTGQGEQPRDVVGRSGTLADPR